VSRGFGGEFILGFVEAVEKAAWADLGVRNKLEHN
jgi:hypothetical protein